MAWVSNKDFFESFVQKYLELALRYVRMRLNTSDAEDLVQEVMIKLYRKAERLKRLEDPLPYLYRSLRNGIIDHQRARKRLRIVGDQEFLSDLQADKRKLEDPWFEVPMEAALRSLPDDMTEVLRLRYFEELEITQIGEVLDLSSGAVAMRLARARAQLKEVLERLESRKTT